MSKHEELERWLESRPPVVQDMARRLPPWKDYTLITTGQRARIQAYAEDGTVRCACWRDELGPAFAAMTLVSVYGISPDDLGEVVT